MSSSRQLAEHGGRTDDPHNITPGQAGADPAGTASDAVADHEGKANAHTPAQVGADPSGTAASAVTAHEGKSGAHTPSQVGADPAGSAASAESAAKAYARQRGNHTGTQPLSTITGVGSAASMNAGTSMGDLLVVGDFGIGRPVDVATYSSDIDTLTTSGIYGFSGNQGLRPSWFAGSGGTVLVSRHGGAYVTQLAISASTGDMAVRAGNGNPMVWQEWRKIYTNHSVVGGITMDGGIPSGAVVGRGSNANGEYVKFADGTLFCWHYTYVSGDPTPPQGSLSWAFPSLFSSRPVAEVTAGVTTGSDGLAAGISAGIKGLATQSDCEASYKDTSELLSAQNVNFYFTARGRWYD